MKHAFLIPALLWLATLVGLASALVGEGVWDALSWMAFAVPVGVSVWFWKGR